MCCVVLISVYMVVSGVPAIHKIGIFKSLFGTKWASTAAEPLLSLIHIYKALGAGAQPHKGRGHNDGLAVHHAQHGFLHAQLRRDAPQGKHHTGVVVELGVHRAGAEGADVDRAVHLPQLLSHAAGHADHIGLSLIHI